MTPTLPAGSQKCCDTRPPAAVPTRPSGRSRSRRIDRSTITSPATRPWTQISPGARGTTAPTATANLHNHSPPTLTTAPVQISSTAGIRACSWSQGRSFAEAVRTPACVENEQRLVVGVGVRVPRPTRLLAQRRRHARARGVFSPCARTGGRVGPSGRPPLRGDQDPRRALENDPRHCRPAFYRTARSGRLAPRIPGALATTHVSAGAGRSCRAARARACRPRRRSSGSS
jgi:hypothetical protein